MSDVAGGWKTVSIKEEDHRVLRRLSELEERPAWSVVGRALAVYRRWLAELSDYTDPQTADPTADGVIAPCFVTVPMTREGDQL